MISTSNTLTHRPLALLDGLSPTGPTPAMLRALRLELGQSLAQFGLTLKRAIDPRSPYGYTRQYISRLEHGQDPITPELAAVLDEVPAALGGAVHSRILIQPGQIPAGAFLPLTARAVQCARPGCRVLFIRTSPNQKYHHPACRPTQAKGMQS
jgi:hypothetical protein